MPRFFKKDFALSPVLNGEDASHITRSLRMKPGEELTVCDTEGVDYRCKIITADRDAVHLEILEKSETASEPSLEVTLFQCLLKGDKFDSVIKHSVELGVTRIVPVISKNCVSRPDKASAAKKTERWQKIALEAAGQSGRGKIPQLEEPIDFKNLSERLKDYPLSILFYEGGGEPLTKIVGHSNMGSAAIVIGSEGGFDLDEVTIAQKSGAKVATLGKRILRAETAPLAALTAIMLLSGNME